MHGGRVRWYGPAAAVADAAAAVNWAPPSPRPASSTRLVRGGDLLPGIDQLQSRGNMPAVDRPMHGGGERS